jgi:choline monooxygenase
MSSRFSIDANIGRAHTLPARFYKDANVFAEVAEKVFATTWQWVAEGSAVAEPLSQLPFALLPGVLDEPLLFTRTEEGRLHCLSNVCTHRAKLIVEKPGRGRVLRCGYHGRCFRLDGSFKSMPEFEGVEDFPGPADHLAQIPFAEWLGLLFVSLSPMASLEEMTAPIRERLGWLPLNSLVFSAEDSKDYHVNAHWALYCDNYLEGFHIPFVHPALNQAIAFEQYSYELFPYGSLQLGLAKEGEPCFDIPPQAQDHGKRIYAYYYWLFPNLMLNFYPWGLSLNVVEPLGPDRTRVRFRTYYYPDNQLDRSKNQLDLTELEDEAVVESVQQGVRSRYYERGRYSVRQETAVHHFHSLLAKALS